MLIVTDNGSNIVKAIKLLNAGQFKINRKQQLHRKQKLLNFIVVLMTMLLLIAVMKTN